MHCQQRGAAHSAVMASSCELRSSNRAHNASTGAFSEWASTSCARPTSLIFAFMVLLSSTFFVFRSECMTCGTTKRLSKLHQRRVEPSSVPGADTLRSRVALTLPTCFLSCISTMAPVMCSYPHLVGMQEVQPPRNVERNAVAAIVPPQLFCSVPGDCGAEVPTCGRRGGADRQQAAAAPQ